jgi:hypothetical protein
MVLLALVAVANAAAVAAASAAAPAAAPAAAASSSPAPAPSQQCNSSKHHPATSCLPAWEPTWDMRRSTFLYACNGSGMYNVSHAAQFGIVSYDWSNGKQLWANAKPMDSEQLLTKSAEAVHAVDPGIPGQAPRVWVYRNTIKALNWYSSVREKLDDPK